MSTSSTPASSRAPRLKTHHVRGAALLLMGVLAMFLLMSSEAQLTRGPLYGLFAALLATFGLFDVLGMALPTPDEQVVLGASWFAPKPGEADWMAPRLTIPLAVGLVAVGIVLGYGVLPYLIVAALLVLIPSALRRPSVVVFVIGSLILLPLLGSFGLWDPWETHYGEVAREILSRDDWISLWWAQEDWFWSKPIFIFWSEALTMGFLGVDFHPDGNPPWPEWAIRLPIYLVAMGAGLSICAAIGKSFGRRAGIVCALVVFSLPHFFLIAHQAITDMPFVGNITMAMSMFMLAIAQDPSDEVKNHKLGPFKVSLQHAVLGAVFLVALPQALYLITRNVTRLEGTFLFNWHGDKFMFGSGGNRGCGETITDSCIPGNKPEHDESPVIPYLIAQPGFQGLLWLIGICTLVYLISQQRNRRALFMYAFYFFCAFAFMAKGIPGIALPGLFAFLYLIASKRWNLLTRGHFRVSTGVLLLAVVGVPWYVAMYVRHGAGFTDRLLIHDHINRLTVGVHGDTGSVQYFIWQLGYAMFPWVALAPAAMIMWFATPPNVVRRSLGQPIRSLSSAAANTDTFDVPHLDNARETAMLATVWFATAFVFFSAMITKFHHYIFPSVPAAGILIGLLVNRLLGEPIRGNDRKGILGAALAYVSPLFLIAGVGLCIGDLRGVIPEGEATEWIFEQRSIPLGVSAIVAGIALMVFAYLNMRHALPAAPKSSSVADETRLTNEGGPAPSEDAASEGSLAAEDRTDASVSPTDGVPSAALGASDPTADRIDTQMAVRPGSSEDPAWFLPSGLGLAAALLAAPCVAIFVGRDLSWVSRAKPAGYERLAHLFTYNYGRLWPAQYDYRPILTGFSVAASVLFIVLVAPQMRRVAARALLGLGLLFAAWTLDFYIVDLSDHWGQRLLVKRYYENRKGPHEPLVSWQMNWKGENFYTGNRTSVFPDLDTKKIRDWVAKHRGSTVFFLTEHTRVEGLRSAIGGITLTPQTTMRECNKFIVLKGQI